MKRIEQEKQYWDKAAADPDVDRKFIADVDTEACLKAIRPHLKYGVTLDLGCGVGRLTIPIAKDTDSFVYGVDISEPMLKIAAERAKGMKNIQFVDNDGRYLTFVNEFFDSAYCMLLFQHLPLAAVIGYISEVSRVLKKGGKFRFQFIDGTEDEPFSKHHTTQMLAHACNVAGMNVEIEHGLVHEQWTWITGVKQ